MTRLAKAVSDDLEEIAATWVARRDAGLTPREAAELASWQAEPAHAAAFAGQEAVWSALARPRRLGAGEDLKSEIGVLVKRRRRRRAAKIVSGSAALLLLGVFWWSSSRPVPVTPAPRSVVLLARHETLPDGSVIEAPADTVFTVDFSDAFRRVHLGRGEALFTVAKNKARPFIVDAGGVEVRAVGTAFSVALRAAQVAVLVTEGRVSVDQPGSANAPSATPGLPARPAIAFVDAGQQVVVNLVATAGAPTVAPVATAEVAERLAWRNPRVEFSGATLREVVEVINRYSDARFVIVDPSIEGQSLSGLFRADDTELFQQALQTSFGIEAERQGKQILLHRKK
ncbi:MAG: anti-FecI sigma factor, FecR [Verrucomicrobia bacterium]|nr:anti-FecI sigma factor, FecR [Verrucomicrobiota bacterium]